MLTRVYDSKSPYKPTELTFRNFGPCLRFDHQRFDRDSQPQNDPVRGVWYGARRDPGAAYRDLACALVEVFDNRIVVLEGFRVARPSISRSLRLLDLRYNGAMLAGTVAELSKTGDAQATWTWSRYFYEETNVYSSLDGLIWLGAHNDGDCVVLFERAASALSCADCSIPLGHPSLRAGVLKIIDDHGMSLAINRLPG